MENQRLKDQLRALPSSPGVYIFRGEGGEPIYVGKAASLRDRVRSYFGAPASQSPKLRQLSSRVADFDFIVTDSEQEALLLECNLIKKHHPRYNIRLRDDKNYPYLKISLNEEWPKVYFTRRVVADGARYFGPYASAKSVRQTMDLTKKLFPYCNCSRDLSKLSERPCLDYHIRRCLGPCIGAVTKEEYRRLIDQVILFLEGRQEVVVEQLRHQMEEAAEGLQFERAAALRDQVRAVERVIEQQKITDIERGDLDVVGLARDKDEACSEVFYIRSGKVVGREHFALEARADDADSALLRSFLTQFYAQASYLPPRILLPAEPEDRALIESWLGQRRGGRVRLLVPKRGEKRRLVHLVEENAREALAQLRVRWLADFNKTTAAMEELAEQLNLPTLPKRIECYDISNIMGTSAVGSMVVFENGRPKSSDYRRFRIKTVPNADDYAMMQEVLRRRFKRAGGAQGKEGTGDGDRRSAWAILPDLVLIDGGKGQLNAALEVMRELEAEFVPVAALAKENEELFVPNVAESILLPRHSQGLYLLQRVRDEAHRFALSYHVRLRQRRGMASALDGVPGIGPKRKRALLRRFGSVKAIREATAEELAAVPGMTLALAERVKEHLWL